MPRVNRSPENLRPYQFHGLDLQWRDGDKEAKCECPACGADDDRSGVNIETGICGCFHSSCEGFNGTPINFIRWLWDASDEATTNYDELAANRELLDPMTLERWGFARSILTKDWIVPGRNAGGKIVQLYRLISLRGRNVLMPTPTIGHGMFGVDLFNPSCEMVLVCEGPWDAMTIWEVMSRAKRTEGGHLMPTASVENNLLTVISVIGVPSNTVFLPGWTSLLANKNVVFCFDNDHPRRNAKSGKLMPPGGIAATKRVCRVLTESKIPPASISWRPWGKEGWTNELKSGFDVRDWLCQN